MSAVRDASGVRRVDGPGIAAEGGGTAGRPGAWAGVCLLLAVLLVGAAPAPPPPPPVLLVVDASGSMGADDGTGRTRMDAAREAVRALVEGLPDDVAVGLRAYGHRQPNTDPVTGCADTQLLVPPAPATGPALLAALDALQPSGFTPIGASLAAAAADLPDVPGRTVVLVSDGIDTCAPPHACQVARELVADGVQLRVEAIGFQVDAAAADQLRCIAEATGGSYRPAVDAEALAAQLQAEVVAQLEVVGTPVEGGSTAADAPELVAGAFLDDLTAGVVDRDVVVEEEWYRVDLAAGQTLSATATIATDQDVAVPVELLLGTLDVIGVSPCASQSVPRIAAPGSVLAVEGLPATGGRVCADPGPHIIGLRADLGALDDDARDALAGLDLAVQLDVAITGTASPDPTPVPTAGALPTAARQGPAARRATPPRLYLATVLGSLVVGGIGGVGLSRRLGP